MHHKSWDSSKTETTLFTNGNDQFWPHIIFIFGKKKSYAHHHKAASLKCHHVSHDQWTNRKLGLAPLSKDRSPNSCVAQMGGWEVIIPREWAVAQVVNSTSKFRKEVCSTPMGQCPPPNPPKYYPKKKKKKWSAHFVEY